MVEVGLTPKIVFKRESFEKLFPGCVEKCSLCYDENLLVLGYMDTKALKEGIKFFKNKGAKIKADFITTEMMEILQPVKWLTYCKDGIGLEYIKIRG